MKKFIVLSSLLGIAPWIFALERQDVVGLYTLVGVRETGSQILFKADGSFQYYLSVGAYNERASGTWRIENNLLVMQAKTYPPPRFEVKKATMDSTGFRVKVVDNKGRNLQRIWVQWIFADGTTDVKYTGKDGATVVTDKKIKAFELKVKVLMDEAQRFPVNRGITRYDLVFHPGGLGKTDLSDRQFSLQESHLIMSHGGQSFRYVKKSRK